jgi:glutathionyl-hydroquinone reductase
MHNQSSLGPGGSLSLVVGLPSNSCKPIANRVLVHARLYQLQKVVHSAASDSVYQLLAHGWSFSPCTPASSTTKTGRHDIAELLLKVALKTINQIKFNYRGPMVPRF